MVQPIPAGKGVPQVLVWAKSPLAAIALILSTLLALLVTVMACAGLALPTAAFPEAQAGCRKRQRSRAFGDKIRAVIPARDGHHRPALAIDRQRRATLGGIAAERTVPRKELATPTPVTHW